MLSTKAVSLRRAAALVAVFALALAVRSLYAVDQAPVMYTPEQTGTRMAQRYDDTALQILRGDGTADVGHAGVGLPGVAHGGQQPRRGLEEGRELGGIVAHRLDLPDFRRGIARLVRPGRAVLRGENGLQERDLLRQAASERVERISLGLRVALGDREGLLR